MPTFYSGAKVNIFATPWEIEKLRLFSDEALAAFPEGLNDVPGLVITSAKTGWWTCLITVNGAAILVDVDEVAMELTGEPDDDDTVTVAKVLLV